MINLRLALRSIQALTIACMFIALGGCGGGDGIRVVTAPVSGKVTWKGEPLEKGVIKFIPDKDDQGRALPGQMMEAHIVNGQYRIEASPGVAVGRNRVLISATRVIGKEIMDGEEIEKHEQYLPVKYNEASTLSALIQKGENTHDFDLTL